MASQHFDVFISFKSLLPSGLPTRDSYLAREVHAFLESKGLSVFLSSVSLQRLGVSAYKQAIDDALDGAEVLVAVGTSREHLESQWVRYEWSGFHDDVLSRVKPSGRLFAYIEGVQAAALPRSLRQAQAFVHGPGALESLFSFISNALPARTVVTRTPDDIVETLAAALYLVFLDNRQRRELETAIEQEPQARSGMNPAIARAFENLNEDIKADNRTFASRILAQLRTIKFTVVPEAPDDDGTWRNVLRDVLDRHIANLAQAEHLSWVTGHEVAGWTLGPRDQVAKQHPSLVPWDRLTKAEQEKAIAAIKIIPAVLGGAKLKAVPARRA